MVVTWQELAGKCNVVRRLVHRKTAMGADGPVRVGSVVAYGRLMSVGNARPLDDTVLARSASPFQSPFCFARLFVCRFFI